LDIEVECLALDDGLGATPGDVGHLLMMRPLERLDWLTSAQQVSAVETTDHTVVAGKAYSV